MKQRYLVVWNIRKNTENKNLKIVKTKNGKIMLLVNVWFVVKKLRFIKKKESKGFSTLSRISFPLLALVNAFT